MQKRVKNQENSKRDGENHPNRYAKMKVNFEHSQESKKKALSIVHSLLERRISKAYLSEQIRYISKDYYDDVITERAIAGVCGYALCDEPIVNRRRNQSYIIRDNKVYDITHSCNFCSDKCYEVSEIIADQIPTIPLYLRSIDSDIKDFNLFIPDVSTLRGRYGKMVNITGVCNDTEGLTKTAYGKSIIEERPNLLDTTAPESVIEMETSRRSVILTSHFITSKDKRQVSFNSLHSNGQDSKNEYKNCIDDLTDKLDKVNLDKTSEDVRYKLKNKQSSEKNMKTGRCSSDKSTSGLTVSLEHVYEMESLVREWMSFETLRVVLGDLYVKGMLEELGKRWEDYDSYAGLRLGVDSKSRYITLCKKLDNDEMREKILDSKLQSNETDVKNLDSSSLKHMPDYDQLRKDVEKTSLKVKTFFQGKEEEISYTNETNTVQNQMKSELPSEDASLPLIDNYSQNSWRRQIVLDRLKKPFSWLVCDFGLDASGLWPILTSIVSTFDLSPHNINMNVRQWKLVALVLIKMISVRYVVVQEAVNLGGKYHNEVTKLLEGEALDSCYLERLLSYLTEITFILSKHYQNNPLHPNTNNIHIDNLKIFGNRPEAIQPSSNNQLLDQSTNGTSQFQYKDKPSTNYEELD